MKHKARTKALSWLLSLALMLSLVPGMGLTAHADGSVTYLDADGKTQTLTVAYNEVANDNGLKAGWNVVKSGTVSIGNQSISGDVNLILCDNTQLTVNGGASSALSITNSGSLTIYAQSTGNSMGKLVASSNSQYALNAAKDITINGGKVSATTSGNSKQGIRADNGSVTINGGIVEANGTSNGIYANDGNVEINGGNVTAKASSWTAIYAYNGTVKNKIPGVGWTDASGSGDGTPIAVSEEGQSLSSYMRVHFEAPAHTHSFTYAASGDTITATCANTDQKCPLDDGNGNHTATLTIKPPANLVYDGKAKAATVEGEIPDVTTPDIMYEGRNGTTYEKSTTAPTEMGDYTACVTLENVKTGENQTGNVTASVDFTIKNASYTITIPATLTVANAGWNATAGITASGEIAEDKKLTVTATSANEWKLKDGENTVDYYLATEEGGEPATVWDFTVDELAAENGTTKTMGAVVEEYVNKPAGTYTDTVTFTAKIESKGPKTYTSLTSGDVLYVGDIVAPNTGYNFSSVGFSFNSGNTYTLLRADISQGTIPTVTEKNDGAYYVFKRQNGKYTATPFEATGTSDGLVITQSGSNWNIAVHYTAN